LEAEGYVDEELRIDLIVTEKEVEICGIQVKPSTFRFIRREVITFNVEANKKWNKPVYYFYYDENENFINLEELIKLIKKDKNGLA